MVLPMVLTKQLADRIATTHYEDIPDSAIEVAKQAIMDFIGVCIAGQTEVVTRLLLLDVLEQGGNGQASVLGSPYKVPASQAALVNGTSGHAHDYDDVHLVLNGHPSVVVAPASFAVAEHFNKSGADLIRSYCCGVDTACIVSEYAGPSHYRTGWHSTATHGCLAAAAASAALRELDSRQTAIALGIAATQAAGLKAQFGTMCKPLHAGRAAATGVSAASLASRGFGGREDILECSQGYGAVLGSGGDLQAFGRAITTDSYVRDIGFKYHAACFLTHDSIDATRKLCAEHDLSSRHIRAIQIHVDEGHLSVCNIADPKTGLEVKFSLRLTVAMAVLDIDTSRIDVYSSHLLGDAELQQLKDKITVIADPNARGSSRITVETDDGRVFSASAQYSGSIADLDDQWDRLARKFAALVAPRLGASTASAIIEHCKSLEQLECLSPLLELLARPIDTEAPT